MLLIPGLAEFSLDVNGAQVPDDYDADARIVPSTTGSIRHSLGVELAGRYGLFRDMEISFHLPWTIALQLKDTSPDLDGPGRGRLALAYRPPATAPGADLAFEGSLLLPTTGARLRTDSTGTLHHDHVAIGGGLRAKYLLADENTAHVEGGFFYPFANQDDRNADRDPPSTFFVTAGSSWQLSDRIFADATAGFTRTNRDRVAGGVVPRTDQFRVDLRPTVGLSPTRWYDLLVSGSIPVAGKNTPQAFEGNLTVRARF